MYSRVLVIHVNNYYLTMTQRDTGQRSWLLVFISVSIAYWCEASNTWINWSTFQSKFMQNILLNPADSFTLILHVWCVTIVRFVSVLINFHSFQNLKALFDILFQFWISFEISFLTTILNKCCHVKAKMMTMRWWSPNYFMMANKAFLWFW